MTDPLRRRPYVWPSWLTKILAKEDRCLWKPWYKATHKAKKIEDPDREAFFKEWTAKHDRLVEARAARLKDEGWTVKVEDEGEFKLEGKTADLAGKPDIVAMRDGQALVVDAKAGRPRTSDHWQVLIYMFALPLSWLRGHKSIHGEVQYRDHIAQVRPLTDVETNAIADLIRLVSDVDNQPPATPSVNECKKCDIAACKVRKTSAPTGDARSYF